jgi:hypothetical protein
VINVRVAIIPPSYRIDKTDAFTLKTFAYRPATGLAKNRVNNWRSGDTCQRSKGLPYWQNKTFYKFIAGSATTHAHSTFPFLDFREFDVKCEFDPHGIEYVDVNDKKIFVKWNKVMSDKTLGNMTTPKHKKLEDFKGFKECDAELTIYLVSKTNTKLAIHQRITYHDDLFSQRMKDITGSSRSSLQTLAKVILALEEHDKYGETTYKPFDKFVPPYPKLEDPFEGLGGPKNGQLNSFSSNSPRPWMIDTRPPWMPKRTTKQQGPPKPDYIGTAMPNKWFSDDEDSPPASRLNHCPSISRPPMDSSTQPFKSEPAHGGVRFYAAKMWEQDPGGKDGRGKQSAKNSQTSSTSTAPNSRLSAFRRLAPESQSSPKKGTLSKKVKIKKSSKTNNNNNNNNLKSAYASENSKPTQKRGHRRAYY